MGGVSINKVLLGAALGVSACQTANAGDAGASSPGHLPPGVQAMINLDNGGFLWDYLSFDQFGTVQTRIGESRSTFSVVGVGAATSGFQDGSFTSVGAFQATHMLADQQSFLRFRIKGLIDDANDNIVENDGKSGLFLAQYERYPSVNSMFAIGAFVEKSDFDLPLSSNTERLGYGIRLDGIYQFSDNWGVIGRTQLSLGESKLRADIAPGLTLQRDQQDDQFYTEGELIGQFRHEDMGWIPEGWAFHPTLGIQFQRNFIETVTDNLGITTSGVNGDTEDYGTAWAKARFAKEVPPGQWSPSFSFGVEQEWRNSLDRYVDEPTYGMFEAGLSKMFQNGTRLDFLYDLHQGFNGNRSSQSFVASLSVRF